MGDSSGGFVLASSQQDPLQSSDPWAGHSSGPRRTATSLLQGQWDRWGPTTPTPADVTQQTYGPARSQPRPHSAPAETRTTMWSPDATAAPRGGMSNATTPAAPSRSTPIPVPPARGGTTPVGVRGAAPMYTMADIPRAVQQGPWTQNAGPGYTTPVQPEPMQYVGPPVSNEPPER